MMFHLLFSCCTGYENLVMACNIFVILTLIIKTCCHFLQSAYRVLCNHDVTSDYYVTVFMAMAAIN